MRKEVKCWTIPAAAHVFTIPIAAEIQYLAIVVSVRRSTATLSVCHRLQEADKRTAQLRRSTRSRRILAAKTRLRIWQTCVLTSALHGLHAIKLGGPDALKLSQWFHRQVRAITRLPAHITKVSNAELRQKFNLEDPITILLHRAEQKLGKVQANQNKNPGCCPAAISEWADIVAHYKALLAASQAKIVEVSDARTELYHACPEFGLYFPSAKTQRQHLARKHGVKVTKIENVQFDVAKHAKNGMPQCRFCNTKFSSMEALRSRVLRNTCEWHHSEKPTAPSTERADAPA